LQVKKFGGFGEILHPFLRDGSREEEIKFGEWFKEKSGPEPQTLKGL